jgi:phosphate/sulfate permease
MGEETQPKKISLKDYGWGIVVANAPMYILNSYRDIVTAQNPIIQILLFLLASLGGCFLVGYSIAKKTGQNWIRAGMTTGLFSYVAYVCLLIITGFISIPIFMEDAAVITGFVGGGALGVKYWEKHHLETS